MKSPKGTSSSTTRKPGVQLTETAGGTDAIALLKQDHRNVEALFKEFQTVDQAEKPGIVRRICNELMMHTLLEEEIFYKECRDKGVENDDLDEAQVEHDSAKVIIRDLLNGEPGSEFYDAKVTVLSEYIKHHVGEEEKPSEGIFAKAKNHGLDMSALGQRLQARKQQLMQKAEANELGPPRPRALKIQSNQDQEYSTMPRYSDDRDRDERGRFRSDDDDDRRYSRSRSSRYDEDDDRRYLRSRSSGYDQEDDDRGSRGGRGRSGWYGDPEGHSEAARSRGSSSRYGDDDNDYRGSGGRGRGRGGWFDDSEGHSEAARQRWDDDRGGERSRSSSRYEDDDDDRRGGGRGRGWYGDSEGHSQAARQRGQDEDRGGRSTRSRSSSRSDDDDDRGSRGHGGWFGDSEGHSRASRRGWRDRD